MHEKAARRIFPPGVPCRPGMKSHAAMFALFSLGLHVLGVAVLRTETSVDAVTGTPLSSTGSVMQASILPEQELADTMALGLAFGDPDRTAERDPEKSSPPISSQAPTLSSRQDAQKAEIQASSSDQDYFSAGLLTRLPVPVTNIDLDVAEIREVAASETLTLTILIDADGTVIEAASTNADDASSVFATRVAEIFKRARFNPGEINGKAVKTRLEINVMSEHQHSL